MARWCWHKKPTPYYNKIVKPPKKICVSRRCLSKEGFGTVSGVVDAQSALSQIDSETALNAYRYLYIGDALAYTGAIDDFDDYLSLDDAHKL